MIDADPRHTVDATNPEYNGEIGFKVTELLTIDPPVKDGRPQAERGDKNSYTEVSQGHGGEEVAVYTRDHIGTEEDEQDEHIGGDDENGHHQYDECLKRKRHLCYLQNVQLEAANYFSR